MPRSGNGSKAGSRRRKLVVDIDPRLDTMSAEALLCRGARHVAPFLPPGPARRAELARLGQVEKRRTCINCGYTVTEVIDAVEKVVVSRRTEYPEGYLMAREYAGTGRISPMDAFLAMCARQGFL